MRDLRMFPAVVLVVAVTAGACATAEPERHRNTSVEATASVTATVIDTATEVALYGLVSWTDATNDKGKPILVALMPDTTAEPQCLGDELAPDKHFPVIKIVTGDFTWSGNPLPTFNGQFRVFSLAGQDVTFEWSDDFEQLAETDFHILSSDTSLNETKSGTITTTQKATLRTELLDNVLAADTALGARARFAQGTAKASTDSCHPADPVRYLAEQNTTVDNGQGEPNCPSSEDSLTARVLAEEMVVRMHDHPAALKIYFRDWLSGERRTLTVEPAAAGVRIELSNQMEVAAQYPDSRHEDLCDDPDTHLEDYLWFYDLRNERDCPGPTLFPCDSRGAGGTKCPQHDWGG